MARSGFWAARGATALAVLLPAVSGCDIFGALGGGAGLPCDGDEACNLGQVCIDHVCRPGMLCVEDDDCAAGYFCDHLRRVCVRVVVRADAGSADQDVRPDVTQHDAAYHDTATADAGQRDAWLPPGLTWIPIPGGEFDMGCSPGDTSCNGNENPRHAVTISGFEMTATEITQAQYRAVTGQNPSSNASCPSCPVEQITWYQARSLCEAVGGRLPSEAEWEYAARAGTTTKYYCGDEVACLTGIAWYIENSDTGHGIDTHPVGSKTANEFDLYDMLGNVWEWNEDCWHSDYTGAPVTGGVWTGGANEDNTYRVVRGGSFDFFAFDLRVSARDKFSPSETDFSIGARCAR